MITSMLIATLVCAGLCLALIPLARKTGLVDHPGRRKVHEMVTPLTGGPAIFIVLMAALAWWLVEDRFVQALMLGGTLMFLVGLVDDRHRLSPITRFVVQVVACLVMVVWADIQLDDFGRLFTNYVLEIGPLAVPITIFAAMGVINAFNMIDGMDGLAGGIFLVAAAGMALLASLAGQPLMHWLILLSMAAVIGFLLLNARFPWNRKARIFLGDSGSMLLGFILAWCFIALGNDINETGERAFMPITAVWLLAVPLLDTTTQMWRRWRAGKSPLNADQFHLHHAFLRAGYSVGDTWFNIMLMALVLGGVGVLFEIAGVPDYLSFWTFMAFAFAYYFYMRRSWTIQRFLGRDFIYNDFDEPQP
jgi:UDP-GlcNAc:undecaprenyl-phosphate GlcNAc-1-phosphate transferase